MRNIINKEKGLAVVGIDLNGYAFIKKMEGCKNTAYKDVVGIPTIGIGFIQYGTGTKIGQKVHMGDTLTDAEIMQEFTVQIKKYEDAVLNNLTKEVREEITQSQVNALVSLCFNIGIKAFLGSTVLRELNKRKYKASCEAFSMWNKAGGKVVQGLVNRRKQEQVLFFKEG